MNEQEIRTAIKQSRAGDSDATDRLRLQFENLVFKLAIGFRARNSRLIVDDLSQEGWVGFARAIQQFDLRRKTKFCTYAFSCIRNAMLRSMIVDGRNAQRFVSSSEIVEDAAAAEPPSTYHYPDLQKLLRFVDPCRRYVMRRLAAGKTSNEIAAELGISKQRVHQLKRSAIERVQTAMKRAA